MKIQQNQKQLKKICEKQWKSMKIIENQ